MLELFNTTNKVRRIPKYRYNGVFILNPKSSVDIEEFAAKFFEPWRRVGVVVRVKTEKVEEISNTDEEISSGEYVSEETDDILDQETLQGESSDKEDEITETKEISNTDEKEPEYTPEYLSELSLKELKDIAISLGIELGDARKKAVVVEAILNKKNS